MKATHIPPPVAFIDIETGRSLVIQGNDQASFADFVRGRLSDVVFARDMAAVESAVRIRDALESLDVEATELSLVDEDHARLVAATRKPARGYPPNIAHCALPFMRAIIAAEDFRIGVQPDVPSVGH
jgi:hypothetical protein